jgi:hypothetical protein
MFRGNIGLGVLGAFVVAVACGGSVKDDRPPSEQLRTDGAARCHAACQTLVTCGLSSDCDCGCSCPAGATDCECGACECPEGHVDTCESECGETVKKVLDKTVPCDKEFVAILDCLASAKCSGDSKDICRTEEVAFKECGSEDHATPPPSATDLPGPAPTGDAFSVACEMQGTIGSKTPPGTILPPGEVSCESYFQGCSDGSRYSIECRVTEGSNLACSCLVDGVVRGTFSETTCPQLAGDANVRCGWYLST